ncbi:MAG: DUF4870 domain-containing protein [Cyclobacteriaceae bacterium]|nr:DUF4870 domain-containing protein [Cyclobacteriaceae bacterium]
MSTELYDIPQPDEIDIREKEDAMGAYFMMFAAMAVGLPLPVVNLIAAIIYYYLNRSKSRFVHFHSLQSLLSQIPTTLLNWGIVYIAVRIFVYDDDFTDIHKGYILMTAVANVIYFIFSIIGAMKARKGKFYYFLFFGEISYKYVFTKREDNREAFVNKPPKM